MMNSIGHNSTPQVNENERLDSPNKVKLTGSTPNNFSRENIFPPIHSAINALATKKEAINVKTLAGLLLSMFFIIHELFKICFFNRNIGRK